MSNLERRSFVQLALGAIASSCTQRTADTCNGGLNMSSPMLAAGLEGNAESPAIRIVWSQGTGRGADLPHSYFASVRVAFGVPVLIAALIDAVALTADREITVRFKNLDEFLAENASLQFMLGLADRQAFIDCDHPGGTDSYQLRVTLQFDGNTVTGAQFEETLDAGAI